MGVEETGAYSLSQSWWPEGKETSTQQCRSPWKTDLAEKLEGNRLNTVPVPHNAHCWWKMRSAASMLCSISWEVGLWRGIWWKSSFKLLLPQGVRDGGGVLEMCFPGLWSAHTHDKGMPAVWKWVGADFLSAPCPPPVLPVSPAKLDLEKFMKLILAFSTTSPSVLFLAWAHSL